MLPPNRLAPLVDAYRTALGITRTQAAAMLSAEWSSMTSWSDRAAADLLTAVLPMVLASQRTAATTTGAYMQAVTGATATIDLDAASGPAVRNGTPPQEVYSRPVVTARATFAQKVAEGSDDAVEAAIEAGLRQIIGQLEFDLSRSASLAAQQVMRKAKVDTYRMVTRPGACALCVAASGRTYSTDELQPLHTNCHCILIPGSTVPRSLQGNRLGTTEEYVAGQTPGERTLVIDEHPELGPVLTWDDSKARGSSKSKAKGLPPLSPQQALDVKANQLAQIEADIRTGRATEWQIDRAAELRAELRAAQTTR